MSLLWKYLVFKSRTFFHKNVKLFCVRGNSRRTEAWCVPLYFRWIIQFQFNPCIWSQGLFIYKRKTSYLAFMSYYCYFLLHKSMCLVLFNFTCHWVIHVGIVSDFCPLNTTKCIVKCSIVVYKLIWSEIFK